MWVSVHLVGISCLPLPLLSNSFAPHSKYTECLAMILKLVSRHACRQNHYNTVTLNSVPIINNRPVHQNYHERTGPKTRNKRITSTRTGTRCWQGRDIMDCANNEPLFLIIINVKRRTQKQVNYVISTQILNKLKFAGGGKGPGS